MAPMGGGGRGGGVSQEGERTLGKEDEDEDEEEHEREEQVLPGRVAYLVPDSKTPRLPVVFDVQCSMFNVQCSRGAPGLLMHTTHNWTEATPPPLGPEAGAPRYPGNELFFFFFFRILLGAAAAMEVDPLQI